MLASAAALLVAYTSAPDDLLLPPGSTDRSTSTDPADLKVSTDPVYNTFTAGTGCQFTGSKKILLLHVGKTSGSTLSSSNLLSMNHTLVNWTVAHDSKSDIDAAKIIETVEEDYDIYVIPTREPLNRLVSAFNWIHIDGGGAWNDYQESQAPHLLHPGLESQGSESLVYDNATVASILSEPLLSQHRPWDSEASYNFVAALSTCFPELPGGVNAFAEALELPSRCGQIARLSLLPTSGTFHLAKGFNWYLNMLLDQGGNTTTDRMRAQGKHVFHVSQENFEADTAALWDYLCVADPPTSAQLVELHPLSDYSNRSLLRHDDTNLTAAGTAALKKYLASDFAALETIRALTENKLSDPVTGLAY